LLSRNHYPFLIRYYEGNANHPDTVKEQRTSNYRKMLFINEYFPNTNQLINEIIYQYPDILVNPTKPDSEGNSPIMQSALQYGSKKLDMLTELKLGVFDMIYAGYCALEMNHINIRPMETYISQGNVNRATKNETIVTKVVNAAKNLIGLEKQEAELEQEIPVREMGYASQDETYFRRWNPLSILFDYRAERIKDLRYIIKKISMSHAEFAVRYPDHAGLVAGEDVINYSAHTYQSYKKVVYLYEIQILKEGNKCLNIVLNKGFTLGEIDWFERPYVTNGFNIKIGMLHDYGKLYPVSMAEVNKDIQDDLNNYMQFMMEVAERTRPKIGYNKNKVKDDGRTALQSDLVNDLVPVDGGNENIWQIQQSNVSLENKELISILQQTKEKLWNVSKQRLGQKGEEDFATELQIQEAGFQVGMVGLQLGLKNVWIKCLDTLKDIIVQYWDKAYWFKITGGNKPSWYEPKIDQNGLVLNPLTEILTADYEIDLDIISAMKPNKEKLRQELTEFGKWLVSPGVQNFLANAGVQLNIDVIKKVGKEWGWDMETFLIPIQQPLGLPGGGLPPAQPVIGNAQPVV